MPAKESKRKGYGRLDGLLEDVPEEIRPDEKKVKRHVNDTLKKLNSALKKSRVKAKAITGGSIAKGTFLRGDHDCDVFVRFNYKKYKDEKEGNKGSISDILGK